MGTMLNVSDSASSAIMAIWSTSRKFNKIACFDSFLCKKKVLGVFFEKMIFS